MLPRLPYQGKNTTIEVGDLIESVVEDPGEPPFIIARYLLLGLQKSSLNDSFPVWCLETNQPHGTIGRTVIYLREGVTGHSSKYYFRIVERAK